MHRVPASLTALSILVASPSRARADTIIQQPGDHFQYHVEIEPHISVAYSDWASSLGGAGYGAGGRFSFPIMKNGFIPTLNNSISVGAGLDLVHFGCGGTSYDCSVNTLAFPVVMQWNFYLTREWSVFGEPGLIVYHQFLDTSGTTCGGVTCGSIADTGARPALWVGARYRINDRLAFTARIGYPTIHVGVSFLD